MKEIDLAIVPLQRLGDGIISLVLANNLQKNKFNVTLYHDFLTDINDWFAFNILPYPASEQFESIMDKHHIVLMDMCNPYVLSKSEETQEALSKKYIFYAVGELKTTFKHDHTQRLLNKLGKDYAQKIRHFKNASRTIKYGKENSMVDNMKQYCEDTLALSNVSSEAGLNVSDNLVKKKYKNRVVLAPTSSQIKKNWDPKRFILLARLLKHKGYQPVISLSMSERSEWLGIINSEFEIPEFRTIRCFSEYLYESGAFIGNDSGGGHLASLLGIPVLTIVNSPRKRTFRWRPGWGRKQVVTPIASVSIFKKRYWREFLPVRHVYRNFKKLIDKI